MAIENWDRLAVNMEREIGSGSGALNDKLPDIAKLADEVIDILKDGWQLGDVIEFFEIIGPLMDLVSSVENMSEPEKDQFIVDAMYLIYQTVDTFPDGSENNIDVPFVFGGIERGLEKRIVSFATLAAVKAVKSYSAKND